MKLSKETERGNVRLGVLSNREQQIATLACRGYPNKLIAHSLNLTEGTVKVHLHAIFRKLDVGSRAALIVKLSNR
jgi:two-component system, NarL family, nitrate/nitrite response regulator NarL